MINHHVHVMLVNMNLSMQEILTDKQLKTIPYDLGTLALDNPFWQFSLQQWNNNALQEILLELQDEQGFRINILLFSIWLAFERKTLHSYLTNIIESTEQWHTQVVHPLRQVRKSLPKILPKPSLKAQIQENELQAEQIEQAILYRCSLSIPKIESSHLDSLQILTKNLNVSELSKSDLLLLIQACLPAQPLHRIEQCIEAVSLL